MAGRQRRRQLAARAPCPQTVVATIRTTSQHFTAAVSHPSVACSQGFTESSRDELPADVRGAILDVLGHEAAARGLDRDGTPNQLGRELDELGEAVGRDV